MSDMWTDQSEILNDLDKLNYFGLSSGCKKGKPRLRLFGGSNPQRTEEKVEYPLGYDMECDELEEIITGPDHNLIQSSVRSALPYSFSNEYIEESIRKKHKATVTTSCTRSSSIHIGEGDTTSQNQSFPQETYEIGIVEKDFTKSSLDPDALEFIKEDFTKATLNPVASEFIKKDFNKATLNPIASEFIKEDFNKATLNPIASEFIKEDFTKATLNPVASEFIKKDFTKATLNPVASEFIKKDFTKATLNPVASEFIKKDFTKATLNPVASEFIKKDFTKATLNPVNNAWENSMFSATKFQSFDINTVYKECENGDEITNPGKDESKSIKKNKKRCNVALQSILLINSQKSQIDTNTATDAHNCEFNNSFETKMNVSEDLNTEHWDEDNGKGSYDKCLSWLETNEAIKCGKYKNNHVPQDRPKMPLCLGDDAFELKPKVENLKSSEKTSDHSKSEKQKDMKQCNSLSVEETYKLLQYKREQKEKNLENQLLMLTNNNQAVISPKKWTNTNGHANENWRNTNENWRNTCESPTESDGSSFKSALQASQSSIGNSPSKPPLNSSSSKSDDDSIRQNAFRTCVSKNCGISSRENEQKLKNKELHCGTIESIENLTSDEGSVDRLTLNSIQMTKNNLTSNFDNLISQDDSQKESSTSCQEYANGREMPDEISGDKTDTIQNYLEAPNEIISLSSSPSICYDQDISSQNFNPSNVDNVYQKLSRLRNQTQIKKLTVVADNEAHTVWAALAHKFSNK